MSLSDGLRGRAPNRPRSLSTSDLSATRCPRRSTVNRNRHFLVILGLLGLSCLVQTAVIRRCVTPGLDAVRFVGIARSIDSDGLLRTLWHERQQPLFPAWVWLVHEAHQRVLGESHSDWATSVQLAAAIPVVLSVVPVYLLMIRMVGSAAAVAGAFFFCLLPEVSRLGADGISDSTHLLFFCLAFWAMVEYFRGQGSGVRDQGSGVRDQGSGVRDQGSGVRDQGACWRSSPGWLLLAGVSTAVALLARAEVLVLALALGVALAVFQFQEIRRQAWRSLATAGGCFALGLAVVLGPYLATMGCITPRAAMDRVLGRHRAEGSFAESAVAAETVSWRLPDGEPVSFDAKEPSISLRRRGYSAAVVRFGRKLADAFGYWIGALALWGAWRLRRRGADAADRFIQIFFVLFCLAVVHFAAAEGYLTPRHLLTLVVAGTGAAGYGALELGKTMTRSAALLTRRLATEACSTRRKGFQWGVAALAGIACLPQTLVRHHHSRLGHRAAGEWLATRAEAAGAVLDTHGWTALYCRRETYAYPQAPAALCDRRLAYVVLEDREFGYRSIRSRTLHWLVAAAAEPVAEFPRAAVRGANQQRVVVYRWYPDRFDRHVASRPGISPSREDRYAQANSDVRR